MSRAAPVGLLLLALLAAPAAAQEPDWERLIHGASLGWEGVAPSEAPCPVTVELEHPGPGELRLELVLRSGAISRIEPLTLPPGARRRVSLAIRVEDGQVLLQLRDQGQVRAARQLEVGRTLPGTRGLLALDGRPPARRGGGEQRWNDTLLPLFSVGAEAAPAEAACYREFAAVYLRGVDPDAWSPEARAALLEHALQGGTLFVAPAGGVGTAPALSLLPAGLAGGPAQVAGVAARVLWAGLGRVLVLEDDVLGACTGTGPDALAAARELGAQVSAADDGRLGPVVQDELDDVLVMGPGLPTRGLLVGFFGLYLLAVGPVLALVGRRMNRRRLLKWTVGLVGSFTLLAPLVAGLVRAAPGTAFVHAIQWVPPEGGPGVELADVTVVSGGSPRAELVLGAQGGPVWATLHPADRERSQSWDGQAFRWDSPRPEAPRSTRGEEVRLDLAMSPWGRQGTSTLTLLAEPGRVRAELVGGATGFVARIENLGPDPLVDVLLVEGQVPGPTAGYLQLGTIAPGERREVPAPRDGLREVDLRRARPWFELVGVQASFRCWGALRASRPDQVTPRYVLLSRARPRVEVLGRRLGVVVSALRVDPVLPPADSQRGYLGLLLADQGGSPTVQEIARGSPAAAAGLAAGDIIQTVDGVYVSSRAELRERLSRRLAGERVKLEVWSPSRRNQRTAHVVLEPRARLGDGD